MHKVRTTVFNIDDDRYEEVELEVSDDLYKIITNGLGASYSISPPKQICDKEGCYGQRPDCGFKII